MNFFTIESEMKKTLFFNQPMFVLLYNETCLNSKIDLSSLPTSVLSLLQGFQYVFTDEIPSCLPPIRGIEHQLLATLSNRPAYRSNHNETKEIQKQVNDLLCKGYVRENMSPYVVPVLLVPKKDGTWIICVDY
ncbi:hypothetical protein CR513_07013, partial [Mucuna pruriens]